MYADAQTGMPIGRHVCRYTDRYADRQTGRGNQVGRHRQAGLEELVVVDLVVRGDPTHQAGVAGL